MQDLDFLAVGDITTDAFIRIKDAHVTCDIDRTRCELCVRFGDKIPYESVTVVPAVGNAPNAAVAAARLGLSAALAADLGEDAVGAESIASLKRERVATDFVRTHEGVPSNYHYVLWYEEERTILVKHNSYPYQFPNVGPVRWLYLSSLGESSLPYHGEITAYLAAHPETKLAFQPGTFQMKMGADALRDIYARADAFFCNREEAQRILGTSEENVPKLLAALAVLGPKVVFITDGPRGAYAFDGVSVWNTPMFPDPKPPVDRTGAGDAFASTVTAMLALGKSIPEALAYGPVNSMSVVQEIGAQKGLLTLPAIEKLLAEKPSGYEVKEL